MLRQAELLLKLKYKSLSPHPIYPYRHLLDKCPDVENEGTE